MGSFFSGLKSLFDRAETVTQNGSRGVADGKASQKQTPQREEIEAAEISGSETAIGGAAATLAALSGYAQPSQAARAESTSPDSEVEGKTDSAPAPAASQPTDTALDPSHVSKGFTEGPTDPVATPQASGSGGLDNTVHYKAPDSEQELPATEAIKSQATYETKLTQDSDAPIPAQASSKTATPSDPAEQPNSAPTLTVNAETSVDEGPSTEPIASMQGADIDGDSVSFVITDASGSPIEHPLFHVVGDEIYLRSGVELDYEATDLHSLYVAASDGSILSAPERIEFTVNDVAEDILLGDGGVGFVDTGVAESSITGGAGADTITGHDDGAAISGGAGNDQITGGTGNDTLSGNAGNDTLTGGEGDDVLSGNAGDDAVSGGTGADTLFGSLGDDTLEGGTGDDSLTGGTGADSLAGGDGDDTLYGNDDADTLSGGTGADVMLGGTGDDVLSGGAGNDTLEGGDGDDTLSGGTDDDLLTGGAGNDVIDGGDGTDSAVFTGAWSDYTITESGGTYTVVDNRAGSPDGTDTLTNVEILRFSDGDVSPADALNDGPDVTATDGTIAENADGAVIGAVNATDPDAGDTVTLSLDDARFEIVGGQLKLKDGESLDYEVDGDSVTVTVTATDSHGASDSQVVTVTVTDVNEAGVGAISDSDAGANAVAENAPIGTAVGVTALAVDGDDSDSVTYTLTDDAGGRFAIDPASGVVTVAGGLDHEAAGSHTIEVTATSSDGSSSTQSLTIAITDQDEAPVITSGGGGDSAAFTVDENTAAITTLVADTDAGETLTYSIAGGDDAALFTIDPATGALSFVTAPDFETPADAGGDNIYDVTVEASDGSQSDSQTISVTVADVNEGPTISAADGTVAENDAGAVVGTVTGSDPDAGDTLTYSVDDARFEVVGGELRLRAGQSLDHESEDSLDVTVTVTDADGASDSQTITVTVADVNEGPNLTAGSGTVGENDTSGATIVNLGASDPDAGDTLTYSVDDARFEVVAGDLRLRAGQSLDHEAEDSLDVTVTATDSGGLSTSETYRVTVADVNEGPTISAADGTVAENDAGAVVGTVTGSDPDAGDTLTYSVDDARFEVVAGQLKLKDGESLDYESDGDGLDVTVTITDSDGASDSQVVTVSLDDVAEDILLGDGGVGFVDTGVAESSITGGAGADTITGHDDGAAISGGAGNDQITGGTGNDTLSGNAGNDTLTSGTGDSTLDGGAGDDRIIMGAGTNMVLAGDGNDFVGDGSGYVANQDDTIDLGAGNDTVYASLGDDTILGGDGDDVIYAEGGDDVITGGAGNDTMQGGDGADTYVFGDGWGSDVITASGSDLDTVDFSAVTTDLDVDIGSGDAGTVSDGTNSLTFDDIGTFVTGSGSDTVDVSGASSLVNISTGAGDDFVTSDSEGHYELGDGNDTMDHYTTAASVDGGAGDDLIWTHYGDDTISGGTGDDTIYAEGGDDTIDGGAGADYISTGSGDDTVQGGTGNDTILGSEGDDVIDGGDGTDTAVFSGDLSDFDVQYDSGTDTFTITDLNASDGDSGVDTITGVENFQFGSTTYSSSEIITPDDGNFVINGSFEDVTGGTDTGNGYTMTSVSGWTDANGHTFETHDSSHWTGIEASDGNLWLDMVENNGDAMDISQAISGLQSGDTYTLSFDVADGNGGGLTMDVYFGGELVGNIDPSATGTMESFSFDISGGAGDGSDTLRFVDTRGLSHMGLSLDNVQIVVADAPAYGGADNPDYDSGYAEAATFEGGSGDGSYYAGNSENVIYGRGGSDTIAGGSSADTIYGGSGDDEIYGQGGDDALFGGSGNDNIAAGVGDDTVYGDGGNDQILGGTGNDALYGGTGHDTIYGQDGHDTMSGGDGNDYLIGDAGNDQLTGGEGSDSISGGVGDDTLYGDAGNDSLIAGDGHDEVHGGSDSDSISAGDGNDTLYGDSGDDLLYGELGADSMLGGDGSDTLYGGEGDDTLIAGAGDDYLAGGDGNDVYSFAAMEGSDTAVGGAGWTDVIELEGMGSGVSYSGGNITGDGWTMVLDSGSVESSTTDSLDLSNDSGGVITFDDGGTIDFSGIERVTW